MDTFECWSAPIFAGTGAGVKDFVVAKYRPDGPRFLLFPNIADRLHVAPSTLRDACKRSSLPFLEEKRPFALRRFKELGGLGQSAPRVVLLQSACVAKLAGDPSVWKGDPMLAEGIKALRHATPPPLRFLPTPSSLQRTSAAPTASASSPATSSPSVPPVFQPASPPPIPGPSYASTSSAPSPPSTDAPHPAAGGNAGGDWSTLGDDDW